MKHKIKKLGTHPLNHPVTKKVNSRVLHSPVMMTRNPPQALFLMENHDVVAVGNDPVMKGSDEHVLKEERYPFSEVSGFRLYQQVRGPLVLRGENGGLVYAEDPDREATTLPGQTLLRVASTINELTTVYPEAVVLRGGMLAAPSQSGDDAGVDAFPLSSVDMFRYGTGPEGKMQSFYLRNGVWHMSITTL